MAECCEGASGCETGIPAGSVRTGRCCNQRAEGGNTHGTGSRDFGFDEAPSYSGATDSVDLVRRAFADEHDNKYQIASSIAGCFPELSPRFGAQAKSVGSREILHEHFRTQLRLGSPISHTRPRLTMRTIESFGASSLTYRP